MTLNLDFKKNESGFTLLESLIALMMTSVILLLLLSGLKQADTIHNRFIDDSQNLDYTSETITGDRQIEWHLFLNQLETYLQGTELVFAYKRQLRVLEYDASTRKRVTIDYKQPDSATQNMSRFKNNGNIRLLTGLRNPDYKEENGWLFLDFTFQNGERYVGRIWVENWVKEKEVIETK